MKNFPKKFVPKKALNNGMSDTLGRGPEIALSILVFTAIGLVIDTQAGTLPWFTIGLVLFSAIGNFARMYYQYDARMKVLEHERVANSVRHQQVTK